MRNIYRVALSCALLSTTACSTMNKSVELGGLLGAASGAAAISAGEHSAGINPKSNDVNSGALVGLGLGILTSYIIYNGVEQERNNGNSQTQMYFGDLPPSPFVFPSNQRIGGQ